VIADFAGTGAAIFFTIDDHRESSWIIVQYGFRRPREEGKGREAFPPRGQKIRVSLRRWLPWQRPERGTTLRKFPLIPDRRWRATRLPRYHSWIRDTNSIARSHWVPEREIAKVPARVVPRKSNRTVCVPLSLVDVTSRRRSDQTGFLLKPSVERIPRIPDVSTQWQLCVSHE